MPENLLKAKSWGEHVQAWRLSKQTAIDWCREHNLLYPTFSYWKRKLEGKTKKHNKVLSDCSSFVELSDHSVEPVGIEIVAGNITIRVYRNFDQKTLESILQVIERSRC